MLPYHEAYFIGRTWGLSRPETGSGKARTASVCLTVLIPTGDSPQTDVPGQGLRPRDKAGPVPSISFQGPPPTSLPLPDSLWNLGSGLGSWCQETSGCPSRLPCGQPSGTRGDMAESSPRAGRELRYKNHFVTRSLFSRPLENESFRRAESPQGFYHLCDCWWARRPRGVGNSPNSSIWPILSAFHSRDRSNNTASHYWEHTPSWALGSAPLCYHTQPEQDFFPTDCLCEAGRIHRPGLEILDVQGQKRSPVEGMALARSPSNSGAESRLNPSLLPPGLQTSESQKPGNLCSWLPLPLPGQMQAFPSLTSEHLSLRAGAHLRNPLGRHKAGGFYHGESCFRKHVYHPDFHWSRDDTLQWKDKH